MRALLAAAAADLRDGGVESPDHDAAALLSHVLGVERLRLPLVDPPTGPQLDAFEALVRRRAAREPLQHLLGTAPFRHVELRVGPGVFVPRPETESLAGWAIEELHRWSGSDEAVDRDPYRDPSRDQGPIVVDLCTGSGAIALAIAHEVPHARVHAVELDEQALVWAARNLSGSAVDLRQGDMADAFTDLDGTVDVVVCNPPYVPLEAWESVAPEARDHDPHLALFSGADGLDAMRVLEPTAARLLRPGGVVAAEHADVQEESASGVFAGTGRWEQVRDHRDLAGRSRFVTARLAR